MTKRLLQINITANWGSHGKIAEGIGDAVTSHGWESHIAYGRWCNPSHSRLYHIGSMGDERLHGVCSRLFDDHGLHSCRATRRLVEYIKDLRPDIIHLHNIHGYYLNYPILFDYLARSGTPVVWTLHDCWTYTGHCAHYMYAKCDRWKTRCHDCPQKKAYPTSLWLDRSERNHALKRQYFCSVPGLTLIPVSRWLEGELHQSFFKDTPIRQIYNGIDLHTFSPVPADEGKPAVTQGYSHMVLGVASNWYRKGLDDFFRLRGMLPPDHLIVIVGAGGKDLQRINATEGMAGIPRTQNADELRRLYAAADVYFNPTWEDNLPTTNIEALACGTPVITYDTGGAGEIVTQGTGYVIAQGDLQAAVRHIGTVTGTSHEAFTGACRERAAAFDRRQRYEEYYSLYQEILEKHHTPASRTDKGMD